MKIYVASSWRNDIQPEIVEIIRNEGHDVYDFKNPPNDAGVGLGFHWSEIDDGWQNWNAGTYIEALKHPVAEAGFKSDFDAMQWCDACVLVMPCGRSAHLEFGWCAGENKQTVYLLDSEKMVEPELMVKMSGLITANIDEMLEFLKVEK